MAHPLGKNEAFIEILGLCYSRHAEAEASGADGWKHRSVEFATWAGEQVRIDEGGLARYPDPAGRLTGCALELASRGYLRPAIITRFGLSGFVFWITEQGRELWEDKARLAGEFPTPKGNFALVVMSFGDDPLLEDAYNGVKRVVTGCGYECVKVDEIEHNRRITDKVIECILSARFIVADLTGERQNCYYEVGFAHAMEKEVILLARRGEYLHFDLKDYNFIIYENTTELESRLKERILATVGQVPAQSE